MKAAHGVFILVIVILCSSAQAIELNVMGDGSSSALLVSGEFFSDDDRLFKKALNEGDFREIWFDSDGGSLGAGIKIGQIIRQRGLATRVPNGAECASACVYSFLGGVVRDVDALGKVGVHMASLMFNEEFISRLREILIMKEEIDLNTRIQLIVSLSEKNAAYSVAAQVDHIVKMGVSLRLLNPSIDTHHWDVYWLSRQELKNFNVVNVN